jgi:hypothetical protein
VLDVPSVLNNDGEPACIVFWFFIFCCLQ